MQRWPVKINPCAVMCRDLTGSGCWGHHCVRRRLRGSQELQGNSLWLGIRLCRAQLPKMWRCWNSEAAPSSWQRDIHNLAKSLAGVPALGNDNLATAFSSTCSSFMLPYPLFRRPDLRFGYGTGDPLPCTRVRRLRPEGAACWLTKTKPKKMEKHKPKQELTGKPQTRKGWWLPNPYPQKKCW